MKTLNLSFEAVLWQYSWVNLVMLMAPFANRGKDEGTGKEGQGKDIGPAELFNMI